MVSSPVVRGMEGGEEGEERRWVSLGLEGDAISGPIICRSRERSDLWEEVGVEKEEDPRIKEVVKYIG